MQDTLAKKLNESHRDALQTYYKGYVAPASVGGQPVTDEDLYQYLLMDTDASEEVETSRVAQAISSLQQYLYRIALNQEPGIKPMLQAGVDEWRDIDSQYAIWSASQQVSDYPENYVSPSTRLDRSLFFRELENTLNQNQLDPDRVQDAVLAYLNEFESVSNLQVINGYCDQTDFGKGKYYFIGRSADQPYQYYWRSLDMSKNGGSDKHKVITPNCWNDWRQIELPLSGDNILPWTIRPVYFNNRLYVTWAERKPTPERKPDGTADGSKYAYSIHYGYLRYDDTWTAPAIADLQGGTEPPLLPGRVLVVDETNSFEVDTVAIVDYSAGTVGQVKAEGNLFVGLFVYGGEKGTPPEPVYDPKAFVYCDTSMVSLLTTNSAMNPNFQMYRPQLSSKDGISSQSVQYCAYGDKYEIVPGSFKKIGTTTGSNTSWASSFPQPTVTLSADGKTLNVFTELGVDPDTRDVPGVDGTWEVLPTLSLSKNTRDGTGYGGSGYIIGDGTKNLNNRIQFKLLNGIYHVCNTFLVYDSQYGEFVPALHTLVSVENSMRFSYANMYHDLPFSVETDKIALSGTFNANYFSNGENYNLALDVGAHQDNTIIRYAANYIDGESDLRIQNTLFFPELRIQNKTGLLLGAQRLPGHPSYPVGTPLPLSYAINPTTDDTGGSGIFTYHIFARMAEGATADSSVYGESEWEVQVKLAAVKAPSAVPRIRTRYDSQKGIVQFLSFEGVGSDFNTIGYTPQDTRLNTTFVTTLIARANISLNALLSYVTQATRVEPPLTAGTGSPSDLTPMDYNGANGLYFWELFFHVPFMVASRFANEGQNDLAQMWLHYIFDPAAKHRPPDANAHITPPDFWNSYALDHNDGTDTQTSSFMMDALLDPDALAYADPNVYKKAVFMAYIRTLIAIGDSQYRMVTPDGLTTARVYYDLALGLLGPEPTVALSVHWKPDTLASLAVKTSIALRDFEANTDPELLELPSKISSALALLDNPNFRAPLNTELLSYWGTLDSRLYNLRNNLSIDGKPLNLPLFAAPADPRVLLTQRAQAGSQGGAGQSAIQIVLPYRFQAMLPVASGAVNMLTQFGDQLLSFYERAESAQQTELGQQQIVDLSDFAISLQKQELEALSADAEALQVQKASADQRFEYYLDNYNENISDTERSAMEDLSKAMTAGNVQSGLSAAGGAVDMAPNIFGLADGGMHWGASLYAAAEGTGIARQNLDYQANRLTQVENYRRRRDDWQEQYIQAQFESEMLDKQLNALALRQKAVRTSIEQATIQQTQQQAMLQFLKSRFTQASLYQWLSGQMSAVYYQAYDSVVSLCLNVQSGWQYEMGDFSTIFVRTNAWNNSYRGLLAGQALALDLHRMERAYYARNDRQLNLSRTVSLKALLTAQKQGFEKWKTDGRIDFELSEELFDGDYPGHYARRLQQVSITLPTLLGPYQNIRALLSQSASDTLFKPDINGVHYLMGNKEGNGSNVVTNLRPSQQVALSGGLDDNGTFALLQQDGRYLPFEGTGVVSKWSLSFPRAVDETTPNGTLKADSDQAALLQALDDILIHIQYTALDGGRNFANQVLGILAQKQPPTKQPPTKQLGRKPAQEKQSTRKH